MDTYSLDDWAAPSPPQSGYLLVFTDTSTINKARAENGQDLCQGLEVASMRMRPDGHSPLASKRNDDNSAWIFLCKGDMPD